MKTSTIAAAAVALTVLATGDPAHADDYRNKILLEMHQVRTGDYTYQVQDNGTITPRYDRYANELRRTRPARDLLYPDVRSPVVARRR